MDEPLAPPRVDSTGGKWLDGLLRRGCLGEESKGKRREEGNSVEESRGVG
jgi:hypothetical protein